MISRILTVVMVCQLFVQAAFAQTEADKIRLNQVGFYTNGPKIAIIISKTATTFHLIDEVSNSSVFTGELTKPEVWPYSEDTCSKAIFTKFNKPGKYHLEVPGVGKSHSFAISQHVGLEAAKASLKMYYYQRASTALPEQYAGKFQRPLGHPDDKVIIHPSAATATRPAGSIISSPGGWYDAGDYNKYIVNSGISTYTLMSAYENFPSFFDTLKMNIPESGNKIPDLLDEVLYNLRWMLTMQDEDGGLYHKLTNPNFDGYVMPDKAVEPRYVVMKTTAASLDFAAVTAQAYRVFKKFNKQLPGLADSCLAASLRAWEWAKKNPEVKYNQGKMNSSFNPDVVTGAYDDNNLKDEFQWAAIELYIATGKYSFYTEMNLQFTLNNAFGLPNWQNVNTLGLYSLIANRSNLEGMDPAEIEMVKEKVIKMADEYRKSAAKSAYGVPMGVTASDFNWGSNSGNGNQGVMLLQAYSITGEKSYLYAAMSSLDYYLGRNGTSYSFVTGFGGKATMHPHCRPSEADGIKEPIPGFVAGGPNPGMEDNANCGGKYEFKLPATAYLDDVCSYASNEIAINWNAPFLYIAFAVEALGGK
ncbi:MAG: glycoside hydrolase family 9 protein [Flavobacteriales bacterium]